MSISNGGPPLDDDDAPGIRVIRIHINDWVASTRGMSLDEEGFFWRFTCLFYDRMGTLPDDDNYMARAMSLDVRAYKRMKAIMVARGKIQVDERKLTNARAEREINNYLREHKRRSDAARQREDNKRSDQRSGEDRPDFDAKSAGSRPEVGAKSPELSPELSDDLFQKDNEINERTATAVPQGDHEPRARARPKTKPKPLVSEDNPPTPQGGPHPLEVAFEVFWKTFPGFAPPRGRKTDKPKALDVFRRIVTGTHRKGLRAKAEEIIAGAKAYAAANPDAEFLPQPVTWLNGARWLDQSAASELIGPNGKPWGWWEHGGLADRMRTMSDDRWRAALKAHPPNGQWPWWIFGPPAGSPDCLMPDHLVEEFGYAAKYKGSIEHV